MQLFKISEVIDSVLGQMKDRSDIYKTTEHKPKVDSNTLVNFKTVLKDVLRLNEEDLKKCTFGSNDSRITNVLDILTPQFILDRMVVASDKQSRDIYTELEEELATPAKAATQAKTQEEKAPTAAEEKVPKNKNKTPESKVLAEAK
jgi:hypothetical protein